MKSKHTISAKPLILMVIAAITLSSCGQFQDPEIEYKTAPLKHTSALKNLTSAPKPIALASEAIYKITTPDGSRGTGFFIGKDGVIATNAHVLGPSNCPASGCFILIHKNLQIGKDYEEAISVFAKPLSLSLSLDTSIFQLFKTSESSVSSLTYTPSHTLKLAEINAKDLEGQTITIVGHPLGGLKKWTSGKVYASQNSWFDSDAVSFGGNSGSPILNLKGDVVGILHRGAAANSNLSTYDYESVTTGSSSAAILEELMGGVFLSEPASIENKKSLDPFLRLDAIAKTSESLLLNHGLFLAANEDPTGFMPNPESDESAREEGLENVDSQDTTEADTTQENTTEAASENPVEQPKKRLNIVELFAEACDSVLKRQLDIQPDDFLNEIFEKCFSARSWINCNGTDRKAFEFCPQGKDWKAWRNRFITAANISYQINQTPLYRTMAASISRLSSSSDRDIILVEQNTEIERFIDRHKLPLDFDIAYTKLGLARFRSDATQDGTDLINFIRQYKKANKWQLNASTIAYSHVLIYNKFEESLSYESLKKEFRSIYTNSKLTIRQRLNLELYGHRNGLL